MTEELDLVADAQRGREIGERVVLGSRTGYGTDAIGAADFRKRPDHVVDPLARDELRSDDEDMPAVRCRATPPPCLRLAIEALDIEDVDGLDQPWLRESVMAHCV